MNQKTKLCIFTALFAALSCISTMLITVFLRLPSKNKANEETKKQMVKRVIIVAVVAVVPSLFLAANMVKDSVFDSNVANFVNQEFQFENTQVVK